jgi:hypothetical protein
MTLKTVARVGRLSLLLLPIAGATALNCGDSGSGGTAGTTGAGGRGGTTGSAGTTGSGGTGGGASGFPACTPIIVPSSDASVLDFATTSGASATFMYGGTFIYPDAGLQADLMGVTSDVSTGAWKVTGLIRNYSGFGLYLSCKLDLSAFTGIQFDISGTFTGNGMGDGGVPATSVTLTVGDAQTDVDSAHNMSPPSWGTCVPATGNQYDGTCLSASRAIPVTASPVTQMVRWADLTGGKKVGASNLSPDPTQVTSIAWVLPWAGPGAAQYTIDITVDNIKFMTQ